MTKQGGWQRGDAMWRVTWSMDGQTLHSREYVEFADAQRFARLVARQARIYYVERYCTCITHDVLHAKHEGDVRLTKPYEALSYR